MHPKLLESLEQMAAVRGKADPKPILVAEEQRKQRVWRKSRPWYIRVYDGYKKDEM